MKVLFVTTEHPKNQFGGLGSFTREITKELRQLCDLRTVYFHFSPGEVLAPDETIDYVIKPQQRWRSQSIGESILENADNIRFQLTEILKDFKPDVIHCNDRQTFMPFRFNDNVVYSSHLMYADLLGLERLDDIYFNELKIEKLALRTSKAVVAYSDFSANRILKYVSKKSLFVLPLGFKPEEFYSNKKSGTINIAYFGRFENLQKGYLEFIKAVNLLGADFKKVNNISFSLYGRGVIPKNIDVSLFDNIAFLKGEDLKEAYAKTDIVVMPSNYEPFGLTGLEAMASGALLLCTKNNGMDEFAEPNKTCLSILPSGDNIADVISKVVHNFNDYLPIREAGQKSVQQWTWKRAALAHFELYKKVSLQRKSLDNYSFLQNKFALQKFDEATSSEKEKNLQETVSIIKSLDDDSMVFLTLHSKNKLCKEEQSLNDKKIVHILNNDSVGLFNSFNSLFLKNKELENTVVAGSWEICTNPKGALAELCRVTKYCVFIFYKKSVPNSWQSFMIENFDDWQKILPEGYAVLEVEPETIMANCDNQYSCVCIFKSIKDKVVA